MKLKCRIKEKDYDIVQGATFSEEFNETLDSGTIILDHIPKIGNLKPFDDVYIWNSDEEFNGYYNIGDTFPANLTNCTIDYSVGEDYYENESAASSELITGICEVNQYSSDKYRFSGSAIDIWSYLVLDKRDESKRFYISDNDKFIFRITLRSNSNPNEVYTENYAFPLYITPENKERGIFILSRVPEDEENDTSQSPDAIYVFFSREVSTFTGTQYINNNNVVNPSDGYIEIDNSAYDYHNNKAYTIVSIEKNGIYGYFERNVTTPGTLTFNNISLTELLTLKNLTLSGLVKGRKLIMDLDYIKKVDGNDYAVNLRFSKRISLKHIGSNVEVYAYMTLTSSANNPTSWSSSFKTNLAFSDRDNSYVQDFEAENYDTYHLYFDTLNEVNLSDVIFKINQKSSLPHFFKHFVIDKWESEMIDLNHENYKYTLSLVSETKRMEKVVCPNLSITQPIAIGVPKRSIFYYMQQYLDLYSPKIKKTIGNNKWIYVNKYSLDLRDANEAYDASDPIGKPLKAIFTDDLYAPEMSLSAPTLRELFSKLMIIKDCIPVVKNDVIYAMQISKTYGTFNLGQEHSNYLYESMDSGSFSTALRKEHQGAISQKNSAHMVEYLGFRNANSALLTLDNLEIETRFPIYKINRIYLCYYRTVNYTKINDSSTILTKTILVKQDITRLVLQNTVRNTLPADWTKYGEINKFDEMSKYKLLTIGYDIGSKKISGWGEKYSYLGDALGWTTITKTYIETMLETVHHFFPYGISRKQYFNPDERIIDERSWAESVVAYKSNSFPDIDDIAAKIKSIFFQVDYNAMYSGTVVHTKDDIDEDDYETTDNNSSSLTVLEVDGLYEKEKANRFGNPTKSWPARYNSVDEMNSLNNKLGTMRDDTIVFHREYQVYEDVVLANFIAMKDYVLKNYYTSVFAKYRTYSYASYSESVERKENDRYNVILSLDKQYYEDGMITGINVINIISAFNKSILNNNLTVSYDNQVNGGYFSFDNNKKYFSDVNSFVSGYSLCFNIRMYDTLTAGLYISSVNCFSDGTSLWESNKQYIGSAQDWYKLPVASDADGFLKNIGCYFGHFKDNTIVTDVKDGTGGNELFTNLFRLPLNVRTPDNYFGKTYSFCKDDKEIIDYTLQYELINYDKDNILFSEWLMKLSEFGNYIKFTEEQQVASLNNSQFYFRVFFGQRFVNYNLETWSAGYSPSTYEQAIVLRFNSAVNLSNLVGKTILGAQNEIKYRTGYSHTEPFVKVDFYVTLNITEILNVSSSKIVVNVIQTTKEIIKFGSTIITTSVYSLEFERLDNAPEPGYVDYYCHGQFLHMSENDARITAKNGKDFPSGDNWNSNLNISNSEIKYGTITGEANTYTFPKTMYILTSASKLENSLIYKQLDKDNLPEGYNIVEVDANDVFSPVQVDEQGRSYIQFKANSALGDNYQSVQYWYLDTTVSEYGISEKDDGPGEPYTNTLEGDGLLHFVFGVNRTKAQGDTKIYVSIVKSRRKEVYDHRHRVIGTIANTLESNNARQQLYDVIEEDS